MSELPPNLKDLKEVGAWKTLALTVAQHPISTFAVICVMATGAFLGYITLLLADVIRSPEWCAKALQAERITAGKTFVGLTACVDLLKLQLEALSRGLLISISSYGLVLIVLIVVVVAGAKASFNVSKEGISGNVSRDAPTPVVVEQPPDDPIPVAPTEKQD